jgi:hypothetical protein
MKEHKIQTAFYPGMIFLANVQKPRVIRNKEHVHLVKSANSGNEYWNCILFHKNIVFPVLGE